MKWRFGFSLYQTLKASPIHRETSFIIWIRIYWRKLSSKLQKQRNNFKLCFELNFQSWIFFPSRKRHVISLQDCFFDKLKLIKIHFYNFNLYFFSKLHFCKQSSFQIEKLKYYRNGKKTAQPKNTPRKMNFIKINKRKKPKLICVLTPPNLQPPAKAKPNINASSLRIKALRKLVSLCLPSNTIR